MSFLKELLKKKLFKRKPKIEVEISENGKEVKIGKQVWMTKNLDVDKFRNGDSIPLAKTEEEMLKAEKEGKPVCCYYDFDPGKGEIYGKLYNWFAVNDKRGLAPEGWHVPRNAEWAELVNYLGGPLHAIDRMKSTSRWEDNYNGTNESGFNALPGGAWWDHREFELMGTDGQWWNSDPVDVREKSAPVFHIHYRALGADSILCKKYEGNSVRCLKD